MNIKVTFLLVLHSKSLRLYSILVQNGFRSLRKTAGIYVSKKRLFKISNLSKNCIKFQKNYQIGNENYYNSSNSTTYIPDGRRLIKYANSKMIAGYASSDRVSIGDAELGNQLFLEVVSGMGKINSKLGFKSLDIVFNILFFCFKMNQI